MNELRIVGDDAKKRSFLLPTRVMYTQGDVRNAETLLEEKTLQILIPNKSPVMMLDNRKCDTPAGVLLDFGRELAGGIRIICDGIAGSPMVRIRFGESASEAMAPLGHKNAGNEHAVRDFIVPVPFASDQEWGQTGFRFAYIELQEPDTAVAIKSILAVFSRRDMPLRGSFRCNDERLNEIFDVAAYTCQLCMQGMLWDGIKRDRVIWIGDSHPEMLTIRSVFGRQPVLEESLDAIRKGTPLPGWMNGMEAYSLWFLCIVYDWYLYTGDRSFPEKNQDYIKAMINQILERVEPDGTLRFEKYFMDWPSRYTYAAQEGVQALCVLAMEASTGLMALFGDDDGIARTQEATAKLRTFVGEGIGSKPAVALLYLAGMLDKEYTAERLSKNGAKGMSTFMSFYVLTAMARSGDMSTALNMLREYYGGMLDMGATSFWEDFDIDWMKDACPIDRLPEEGEIDIHGDFGAYCYKQFRHSLCHGWSSGPVPFLLESVLGIHFDVPGGKVIRVKPALGDLAWAEGTYPLPEGGELFVRCEQTAEGVKVMATAPEGVTVITE